jgi:hypothetical protein
MAKLKDFTLGATGQFPRGQADLTDEGEIRLALATDHVNAIVRIVFGKPVGWLGLSAEDARALAQMLVEKADELDRRLS